jgi:predicted ATP-grasp superfamily ATP-dependent carboligase
MTRSSVRPGSTSLDVLVLDARLRQSLVCVQRLGRSGLTVGAAESAGPGDAVPAFRSRWCRLGAGLPAHDEPDAVQLRALLKLLQDARPRVLLPSHDGTIELVRRHRAELERHVALALAPEGALAVAVDKDRTLELAERLGVGVPRGVAVRDPADLRAATREVRLPAVVKPVQSWLGSGASAARLTARLVCSPAELDRAAGEVLSLGGQVLVQPWLPGRREAVMTLRADGRLCAEFAQVAHRMTPPLGGTSVLRESIAVPDDIGRAARELVDAMGLDGVAEVEFRRDVDGRPLLMEVNPRLSASVLVAVRAGVDLPGMLWRWAAGEPVQPVRSYRTGVRVRWLGGEIDWLRETLHSQGRPDVPTRRRAAAMLVRDSLRPCGYDYVDLRDPVPAVVASSDLLGDLSRAARRRLGRPRPRAQPAG